MSDPRFTGLRRSDILPAIGGFVFTGGLLLALRPILEGFETLRLWLAS